MKQGFYEFLGVLIVLAMVACLLALFVLLFVATVKAIG